MYQSSPTLIVPREEFRNRIESQIQKGNDLHQKEFNPLSAVKKSESTSSEINFEYSKEDKDYYSDEVHKWYCFTKEIFQVSFDLKYEFSNRYFCEFTRAAKVKIADSSQDYIGEYKNSLRKRIRVLESIIERLPMIPAKEDGFYSNFDRDNEFGEDIFVVHGHDEAVRQTVVRVLETLDLGPIILNEQTNKGRTIIEKLEQEAANAGFAVILMTADDFGHSKAVDEEKPRARQNVIMEMGYFMGKLGRSRVFILLEEGVEIPSDNDGIVYTSLDKRGYWKYELIRELRAAGFDADANKLM